MSDVIADLFGETSDRLVETTGWIGEDPLDGGDIAHLLIYPTGFGVARKMQALAVLVRP